MLSLFLAGLLNRNFKNKYKMKTPIRQLIEELKATHENCLPEFKNGIQHSILRAGVYSEVERQDAIDFAIFCNDNYISNGKREEYKFWQSCVSEDVYTTAELYKHFCSQSII
jgi:hypothetical protein